MSPRLHITSITGPESRARKLEPVDLGYILFCTIRCVERDPMGWLRTDKEPWIKAAQEFMRMAGLQQ